MAIKGASQSIEVRMLHKVFHLLIPFILGASCLHSTTWGSEGGVSPAAYKLCNWGAFSFTNSMVMSWVVSIGLVLIVRWMLGSRPALLPGRGQAVLEVMVEGVKGMITPIVGERMVKHTFPLLVSIFLFILVHNWSGLIPGVGTIGKIEGDHLVDFFRPGNADLNGTLALALIAMVSWLYFVLRYAGVKALAYDLFGNKANKKEIPLIIYYFLFFIFMGVGFIEVISILFRPISLSLRLYGNVFGGENLLHSISGLMAWIVPVPFYFLEVLIGLIQALVFTLLLSVYIGSICNHGDDH
jgi:F-type H+-transporting ATPase subunit a